MKKFVALITAGLIMLNSTPVWAVETANKESVQSEKTTQEEKQPETQQGETLNFAKPIVTDEDINNAVMYGIISEDWVSHLDKTITTEQIKELAQSVTDKVNEIKALKKQDKEVTFKATEGTRQKAVLEALYQAVCQYNFTFDDEVEKNQGVDYLKAVEILDANATKEDLEKECTCKQAVTWAVKLIDKVFDGEDAGSKGFFWKVEKGDNTVYMLGSIHLAEHSIYPFSDDIMEAYEKADALGVEVDLANQEGIQYLLSKQVFSDETTLKDHISEGLYEKVMNATEMLGGDKKIVETYKPWALALTYSTLASSMGIDEGQNVQETTELGVDNYLLMNASLDKKAIEELEGYQYQADMFEGFSDKLQEYYIEGCLDSLLSTIETVQKEKEGKKQEDKNASEAAKVSQWLEQWKTGDVNGFAKSYPLGNSVASDDEHKEEIKEYNTAMYDNRNIHMAEEVEKWLNQKGKHTMFVVVGAAHYIGETGVIAQLTNKGYKVTQIK